MKKSFLLFCVLALFQCPVLGSMITIQLPFYDGKWYQCTQNSDDTPTHRSESTRFDLDFGLPNGSIVVAAADGVMRHRNNPGGFGLYARVDHHDGKWTMYAHLSGYIVPDGQSVKAGQPIAYSGNSGLSIGTGGGYHLHVGVHEDGANGGVGISQPMRVYALERNTGTQGYFETGLQGSSGFTCGLSSLGHTYESRPIGDNAFSNFSCRKLSGTNGVLCWQNSSVDCVDGSDHVRYFRNAQGAMQGESRTDTWRWCLEDYFTDQPANIFSFLEGGYGLGGSTPPPTPLPNLQVEEITVHTYPEGDDTRLTEERSVMNLGQTYQINVWPVSHSADCQNGNMTGNPDLEVKTDTFFKIALSEDEGTWQLLKRSETHCKYLAHGDSKKEVIPVTIPPDAAGKRLYLKSETDATGDVAETDEGDNRSGIEWYPIQGACNLAISSARLTGQRVDLIQGENYGFAATLVNMGPDPCPRDTRLSYFYRKPIAGTDWILADGDDTPASKLVVGQSNEEWMTADTIIADTVGIHQARVCADTNDANSETNESDNCFTFLYAVNPPPPSNIVVTDPPPGATWRCSTKSDYQYIRWTGVTFAQSPTVELWYSLDNGASWKLIDAAVDNDGKYRWYMCKYPIGKDSSFGRVKVVAKYGGQAFSAISGQFFIDYARGCK